MMMLADSSEPVLENLVIEDATTGAFRSSTGLIW
jgi:hypothetical protein